MKHARLLIILTIALVTGFAVFFVVSLFTVKDVVSEYSVYGAAKFDEVESILSEYEGRSLVFVDCNEIKDRINKNTIYNVESVKKEYPSTIRVELSSRQERYAVVNPDGGYFILDEIFAVSDVRANYKNNADELDNVLLTFIGVEEPELVVKTRADYENNVALSLVKSIVDEIDGPRDHLVSIVVEDKGYNDYYVTVDFFEGVTAEIRKADEQTAIKAQKTFERYFALSDKDKLSGKIICFALDGGEVVAQYDPY